MKKSVKFALDTENDKPSFKRMATVAIKKTEMPLPEPEIEQPKPP